MQLPEKYTKLFEIYPRTDQSPPADEILVRLKPLTLEEKKQTQKLRHDLSDIAQALCELATHLNAPFVFAFNGKDLKITTETKQEAIQNYYSNLNSSLASSRNEASNIITDFRKK
jgi:hypothetical protein